MREEKSLEKEQGKSRFEGCPDIPNLHADSFFTAELERAVRFLKEHPIPEWILNRTEKPE